MPSLDKALLAKGPCPQTVVDSKPEAGIHYRPTIGAGSGCKQSQLSWTL